MAAKTAGYGLRIGRGATTTTTTVPANLGQYRFDNIVSITSDVTISGDNLSTFNNKIWILRNAGTVTVTVAQGAALTFFGIHVENPSGEIRLTAAPGSGNLFSGQGTVTFQANQSVIFFRSSPGTFRALALNGLLQSFTQLIDTPENLGSSGQGLRVNAAGTALEFFDLASGVTTFSGLSDTPASLGTVGQLVRVNPTANALEFFTLPDLPDTFAELTDTPSTLGTSGQSLRVNTDGDELEFFTPPDPGSTTFAGLTDTPASLGTNGQLVAVNAAGNALEFINPVTNGGATTFLALSDTPATLTALQFVRANAAGDALELVTLPAAVIAVENNGTQLSDTVNRLNFAANLTATDAGSGEITITGPTSADWDHQSLPSGTLPANNRRWYSYTGTSNVFVNLPAPSSIFSGWTCFFANDSTTATITLDGDFPNDVEDIALLPHQGCIVSYNGTTFVEGPSREVTTLPSFPDWDRNPMMLSTNYQTFSTNANGLNAGSEGAISALLNRTIRITTRQSNNFSFDLPGLTAANLSTIPLRSGYGIFNNGRNQVIVRPSSTGDTITRGTVTNTFTSPFRLLTGASVIIVRDAERGWNVTLQSGTITN